MEAPLLAHTVTKLKGAAGRVVVCGSHGGAYAGLLAVEAGLRGILLNDAGVGREDAGIAGLDVCEASGMAAAALGHTTCRIGNAEDALARGRVTFVNPSAERLGIEPGMTAAEAADRLAGAPLPMRPRADADAEHRHEETINGWHLAICDSASLIRPGEDDGWIVVTASHGGVVGDDPATASKADAALLAFNDAGVGLEDAGVSRLPALQARGIAAVCVDCASAKIGDGASTYEDGVISHMNAAATAMGATAGEPLASFIARVTAAPRS
ncbi:hypothetical protein [Acuticoccus mangrovi]|uniref:Uncharacterized protein n=1 Tax=Acuticoccus mangrovi TaxID=2796142 RepID=A0A934IRQ2_9HYPH|nr:hypothetical protein [Acuticoccus mangrovi]MBJ3777425.1 hypothetical protein [Acuticoccus mangrovi]